MELSAAARRRALVALGVPGEKADHATGHSPMPATPPARRGMNKWEALRAQELDVLQRAGQVTTVAYESVTLKLADDVRYTPDFFIVHADGRMEFEEVKGHMRDDARVKVRVAARQFPMFAFTVLTRPKGARTWQREAIRP